MEVLVCAAADFPRGSRRLIKAGTRNIAVYNHRGQYYALDNACYHHGGPLLNGDIEELGGHPCVKCPWHSYKITLDTGEGLYFGVDLDGSGQPHSKLKSKGTKQRTHPVYVKGNDVYCLVSADGTYESDTYAEMDIANREQATPTNSRGFRVTSTSSSGSSLHSSLGSSQGAVDPKRSGAFLGGFGRGLSGPVGGFAANSESETLIRIVNVTNAARDGAHVKTFTFDRVKPGDRRKITPGMWVRLRLPVKANDGTVRHLDRQWSVTHVRGPLGGWFSVTVRNRPTGGGGSRWLFSDESKHAEITLAEVGGDFTFQAQRAKLAQVHGRMLMISAGIGVTPMFAAVHTHASDPFATVSGPPLHIVHVHAERNLSEMAFADELAQVHAQCHNGNVDTDPFSYRLRLNTTGTSAGCSPLVASVSLTSGRLSLDDVKSSLDMITGAQDAKARPVLVMLCGPEEFMAAARAFCNAAGVGDANIVSEDFD
jgi:ferredoxin-NADP reductase/nitrite reductase/ring-hydroxylating ferredoxin subunit